MHIEIEFRQFDAHVLEIFRQASNRLGRGQHSGAGQCSRRNRGMFQKCFHAVQLFISRNQDILRGRLTCSQRRQTVPNTGQNFRTDLGGQGPIDFSSGSFGQLRGNPVEPIQPFPHISPVALTQLCRERTSLVPKVFPGNRVLSMALQMLGYRLPQILQGLFKNRQDTAAIGPRPGRH